MNTQDQPFSHNLKFPKSEKSSPIDLASRWILSKLAATANEMGKALEEYRFNDAANSIYQFIWHEFCDWYIEMAKIELQNNRQDARIKECLLYTLDASLRLLHPFMPFVTEEIWQKIHDNNDREAAVHNHKKRSKVSIMISDYPQDLKRDFDSETAISYIIEAITGIRTIRGELNIPPSVKLSVFIKTLSPATEKILNRHAHYIKTLAKAKEILIRSNIVKPECSATAVKSTMEIYIPLKGVLNISSEVDRLKKDVTKVEDTIASLDKKLLNEDFLSKAPKEIVEKEKSKYEELINIRKKILESIKLLEEVEVKKNV
jgi:valyl-tRNA synthetase